jgi:hypothetical protein
MYNVRAFEIPDGTKKIEESQFSRCSSLERITIPDSVTKIGDYAFSDCSSLTSVTIPNSVTSIGDRAFEMCKSLYSITIPQSVTSIGKYAFSNCDGIIEVCNKSSLKITAGSSNYGGVASYAKHVITDESRSYLKYIDDFVFYDDGTNVYFLKYLGEDIHVTLPQYNGGTPYEIYAYAFYHSRVYGVEIPDSVTSIGYSAFRNCYYLDSVRIPTSVTSIGNAFVDYYSLDILVFEGTMEQWKSIDKKQDFDNLDLKVVCSDGALYYP